MKTTFKKRIGSALIVIAMLLSIMVCQFASAWNEYSGDLPYSDSVAQDEYPLFIKDGYYISSSTEYIKYDGKYKFDKTTKNTYTFNDYGYVLTKQSTVNPETSDSITYPVVSYSYDNQGRIKTIQSKDSNYSFEYKDDGSFIQTDEINGDHYTFTPNTFNVMEGVFSFEFDAKGRISKITGKHEPSVGPRFNEIRYTYSEDSSGRVIKKNYEKFFSGKSVETGTVDISYSQDGRTEVENYNNYTKTIVYNNKNQVVSYSLIEKLEDASDLTYDSVETLYKYTYDENGNPIIIDIPDTQLDYDHRIELTYEYHPKKALPPQDDPTPVEPDEPTPTPIVKQNGLADAADKNGDWWYYKDGKIDTTHNGVDQNKFGWWRVEKGKVNFKANGIYQNSLGWWKTTNGKVTFKENGVFSNNLGWWKVKDSKVDFSANGIYQNSNGWWKTTNGKVTFKENGIFQNENGWWKVKDSKVDFKFTGIASNKNGSWYIKDGKVDFSKNGKVKYNNHSYTIENGQAIA